MFILCLAVPLDQLKPLTVSLPGQPCHLGLSADELTLSVCVREPLAPCMLYDTRSFCEPVCVVTVLLYLCMYLRFLLFVGLILAGTNFS